MKNILYKLDTKFSPVYIGQSLYLYLALQDPITGNIDTTTVISYQIKTGNVSIQELAVNQSTTTN